MPEAPNRFLLRAQQQARRLLDRPDLVGRVAARAARKADGVQSRLQQGYTDLQTLVRLVKAWASGQYRSVPVRSLVAILGALIYFLIPLDAVPDFIAALGLLDDLAVIAKVAQTFSADLDDFRRWEAGATDSGADDTHGE